MAPIVVGRMENQNARPHIRASTSSSGSVAAVGYAERPAPNVGDFSWFFILSREEMTKDVNLDSAAPRGNIARQRQQQDHPGCAASYEDGPVVHVNETKTYILST
jgi:hypothetical protein